MDALTRLLAGLLWHSARLVPARRRDWVEAVLAETAQAPAGAARVAWLCGGLRLVAREAVMGRMAATARLRGRPANKAVRWAAFAPVPPLILVASLLPDNGLVYGVLAPIAVLCLVGWLLAGIVMLTAWRRHLLAAGGEPAQIAATARWSAATRARLATLGVCVLYGVVLPGVLAATAIPGYAPASRAIATTVVTYLFFWLLGIGLLLVTRSARVDPDDESHRVA